MRMISNLTLLSSSSEMELASSTAGITSIKSSCKLTHFGKTPPQEIQTCSRAMSLLLPLWPSTFENYMSRYYLGWNHKKKSKLSATWHFFICWQDARANLDASLRCNLLLRILKCDRRVFLLA